MFHQIFFSPQVKRCAMFTYKYGVYVFTHEFSNDLRLRILRNYEISGILKTLQNNNLVPSLPAKTKILLILPKNFLKTEFKRF